MKEERMPVSAADTATAATASLSEAGAAPVGLLFAAIAGRVSAGGDLRELIQRFLDPVVRLAGAQGGSVRLFDERRAQLQRIGEQAMPPGLCRHAAVDTHCGVCGAAALGPDPQWADGRSGCPELAASVLRGDTTPGTRLLAVPLQHRGEPLGLYNLVFPAGYALPGAELLSMLRAIGEVLGLALHHARLESAEVQALLLHERQTLAADLHDAIGQSLTFCKMRLPLLEDALAAGETPRALRYCGELRHEATQAHAALRCLLTQMRAPMDPQGLWHALQVSTEQFRRRSTTQLAYENELPELPLDDGLQSQIFHIVQEALNNISRHAQARHAWLRIGPARGGGLQVRVEDDGTGLPVAADAEHDQGTHYGLAIMQSRAQRLGGALQVGPREGGGTVVQLHVPAPAEAGT